ncbi:MAG: L-threonylcarbamoyladenylate synthase [Thermoleophilia bacterium]
MTQRLRQGSMSGGDWEKVSSALAAGSLAILPSDTVYGLACLAADPDAIEKIYRVKGRPADKPLALVFSRVESIGGLVPGLPEKIRDAVGRLLPGPVTAIIPFEEGTAGIEVRGAGSAGVRVIPPPAGDLYRLLPEPLAVTSANLSGTTDPVAVDEVSAAIMDACEYAVDAGRLDSRTPSTVIDLRPLAAGGPPVILRQGAMSAAEIQGRLGLKGCL